MEEPLPGHRKTQLVLKIISGQQLPKPKDSMFGDRGEVRSKYSRYKVKEFNKKYVFNTKVEFFLDFF